MKTKHVFSPVYIKTSAELESVVRDCLQNKEISHFLFVNEWERLSSWYMKKLKLLEKLNGESEVYVISIFDVPNGLNIIKSAIKEFRETISTNSIQNYSSMPMLIRLHGAFPVAVSYSGSISAELGL